MDGRTSTSQHHKVAILWRGDAKARRTATAQNNRFHRIFEELAALDIRAEPAVYDEEFAHEVREQLLSADAVLVWVDPIHRGKTRAAARNSDELLRVRANDNRPISCPPAKRCLAPAGDETCLARRGVVHHPPIHTRGRRPGWSGSLLASTIMKRSRCSNV
jgi:hypothetical protein